MRAQILLTQKKYATIPEGLYEAKVGMHRGRYPALRLGDVNTLNFDHNLIELGAPNPSDRSRTTAIGINIHKPGARNLTGEDSKGRPISAGCLLIDIYKWEKFIETFIPNKNSIISVYVSRTPQTSKNK